MMHKVNGFLTALLGGLGGKCCAPYLSAMLGLLPRERTAIAMKSNS